MIAFICPYCKRDLTQPLKVLNLPLEEGAKYHLEIHWAIKVHELTDAIRSKQEYWDVLEALVEEIDQIEKSIKEIK